MRCARRLLQRPRPTRTRARPPPRTVEHAASGSLGRARRQHRAGAAVEPRAVPRRTRSSPSSRSAPSDMRELGVRCTRRPPRRSRRRSVAAAQHRARRRAAVDAEQLALGQRRAAPRRRPRAELTRRVRVAPRASRSAAAARATPGSRTSRGSGSATRRRTRAARRAPVSRCSSGLRSPVTSSWNRCEQLLRLGARLPLHRLRHQRRRGLRDRAALRREAHVGDRRRRSSCSPDRELVAAERIASRRRVRRLLHLAEVPRPPVVVEDDRLVELLEVGHRAHRAYIAR